MSNNKFNKNKNTECCICYDIYNKDNKVFLHKTRRQIHAVCVNCFLIYISTTISNDNYKVENDCVKVLCFGKHMSNSTRNKLCEYYFDVFRSIKFLPSNIKNSCDFKSILNIISRILILSYQEVAPCIHAYDSSNPCLNISYVNEDESKVICQCGIDFCHVCKLSPYHTNAKCEDVKDLKKMELSLDSSSYQQLKVEFKNNKIKCCPNCKVLIEKNRGCNKMKCNKCKKKFCWLCLIYPVDYSHFNYLNHNRCSGKLWD